MKIDSFTTAKCIKCGWVKQFQPGKEYDAEEFICNCKKIEETRGAKNGSNRAIKKNKQG